MIAIAAIGAAPALSPTESGPLAPVVEVAFSIGFGGPLSGKLCTFLGITKNNQTFPVEQISSGKSGDSRSLNVSRHRGYLDIFISRNTKEETVVFLTNATGTLFKAAREKKGALMEEIPMADATPLFEVEKTWWIDTWLAARKARTP